MTLYKKRDAFKGFSKKIGIIFSKLGIPPNAWTMLSIIIAVIAAFFLITNDFLLALIFLILAAFLDLIDGSVARSTGKASKIGAYLDTVVDRYVEGIIVLGLLLASLPGFLIPAYAWIFLYFFGSIMTSYVKAAATEKKLVKKELKGGILERADRLIILFIGIFFAIFSKMYLTYVLIILVVLTNVTVLQRIGIGVKNGKQNEKSG